MTEIKEPQDIPEAGEELPKVTLSKLNAKEELHVFSRYLHTMSLVVRNRIVCLVHSRSVLRLKWTVWAYLQSIFSVLVPIGHLKALLYQGR